MSAFIACVNLKCQRMLFLLTSRKTSFIFLIEEQACTLTLAGSARWTISGMASRSGGKQMKIIQLSAENVADERDYQVWVERVEPGKVGFVIEDGQVKQEVEHVAV